ncbi:MULTISPECIES: hypothetical protein [Calditerrivibrio]|uniref:hypothetical protein n=1 Tax=Calditerrivibrio TaxID=545865 RepID=UPI003C71590D
MSKNNNVHFEEVVIDKVESYINSNFKRILGFLVGIVVIGLAVYGLRQYYESQKNAEINKIGEFEAKFNSQEFNPEILVQYVKTCESISSLKDYCYFRAGAILATTGDNKGKEYLKKVGGNYKEFADSLLFDLGEKVDINQYKDSGKLATIWKYRAVLQDKKLLSSLDNATLNTRLISNTIYWE